MGFTRGSRPATIPTVSRVGSYMRKATSRRKGDPEPALRCAGLFAGIGGIELGLHESGHKTAFLCEFDPNAALVLQHHFPDAKHIPDVNDVRGKEMPDIDLLAGGFPCQDLSQAGRTAGISGARSGLVGQMFRIIEELSAEDRCPKWLMIENVENMLRLDQGKAMNFLVDELERLGFNWAYRLVDTQSFGLPQRRQRVIMLASRTEDPAEVLFADDAGAPVPDPDLHNQLGHGFYWTEGVRGLGWAPGAIPTLKGGSSVGIPSAPAVWMPDDSFVTPSITDAERLQGFPKNWTKPGAGTGSKARIDGPRWRMVGNAVSVPVATWVGYRLRNPEPSRAWRRPLERDGRWPDAAAGYRGRVEEFACSTWPLNVGSQPIAKFIKHGQDLSLKAASGFRERTFRSNLNFSAAPKTGFLDALDRYIRGRGGVLEDLEKLAKKKAAKLAAGKPLRDGSPSDEATSVQLPASGPVL